MRMAARWPAEIMKYHLFLYYYYGGGGAFFREEVTTRGSVKLATR